MKILTTTFLLLLNISQAFAETADIQEPLKEYDIEIIIFEDAHARYLNSESWHKHSSNKEHLLDSDTSKQRNSNPDQTNETDYTTIDPTFLKQEYTRINNSSEFNVLQYSAWRQAGLKKADAFEIDINKLNNNHRSRSENTLSGKLKVVLARYLHFYSELEYERQNDEIDALADSKSITIALVNVADENKNIELQPVNNIYRLQSHRRMRSKELHYVDHPLVGMLIQINPVTLTSTDQAN